MTQISKHKTYEDFFFQATGQKPYPYQCRLATNNQLPHLLSIPTGLGKTAAVTLAWIWQRFFASPEIRTATPRRLVYCLPMRVLVEQTFSCISHWLKQLGLTNDDISTTDSDPAIYLSKLLGGYSDDHWDRYPEKEAILVGTQDMLLSRAMNRGYGMSRFRWPMDFGLLNNDCLWVFDEVQLMGSGLASTAQLAAFWKTFGTVGPISSIWMSATMQADWLKTIDFAEQVDHLRSLSLDGDDLAYPAVDKRFNAPKPCLALDTRLTTKTKKNYAKELAEFIRQQHRPGTLTLIILNTVDRAVQVYDSLAKQKSSADLMLLHSRFRPYEREEQRIKLQADIPANGRIIVSTQVVEAGVDIDAKLLITELAPWASLVQRFGRCNRTGMQHDAQVYWVDLDSDDKFALPYSTEELDDARSRISTRNDVGPVHLGEEELTFQHSHILRRKDILELFDTTPDLTGADIDISHFIRDTSEHDLQVFWRKDLTDNPTPDLPRPHRQELCPVPIPELKNYISNKRSGWRWDLLDKQWVKAQANNLYPGLIVLLEANDGGYDPGRGWTPDSKKSVEVCSPASTPAEGLDDDPNSATRNWCTLADHTQKVLSFLYSIVEQIPLESEHKQALEAAARWHDIGKAHPVFQRTMLNDPPLNDPNIIWAKTVINNARHARKGFRHELASGLALLQNGYSDLVAYLVAAHHGRVRLSIRSFPHEDIPRDSTGSLQPDQRFALGIWEGDQLPLIPFDSDHSFPATTLDLSYLEIGDGPRGASWTSRMLDLRDTLGPFRLAYLEAILRAADHRGSEVKQ